MSWKILFTFLILEFIIYNAHCRENSYINNNQLTQPSTSIQIVLPYLQSEMSACSHAQQSILNFLHEKYIPIGMSAGSLRETLNSKIDSVRSRIIVSTSSNNIECRVSLEKAPIGSKCVAPCGCTGSSKWVQFAELNKLRRKDPQQWTSCPTCQQKFDYSIFVAYGGLPASLIGYILDNLIILRGSMLLTAIAIGYIGSFRSLVYRFLVSKALWQQFPQWSKITHIPLALKFWAVKIIIQYVIEKYTILERNTILTSLAEIETKLIEENLPVIQDNSDEIDASSNAFDDDSDEISSGYS